MRSRRVTVISWIGIIFLLAAAVHASELAAALAGWDGRDDYPLWRHALFVLLNTLLAAAALAAPRRLWLLLLLLLAQQGTTHGVNAWHRWTAEHRIAWLDALLMLYLAAITWIAGRDAWVNRSRG